MKISVRNKRFRFFKNIFQIFLKAFSGFFLKKKIIFWSELFSNTFKEETFAGKLLFYLKKIFLLLNPKTKFIEWYKKIFWTIRWKNPPEYHEKKIGFDYITRLTCVKDHFQLKSRKDRLWAYAFIFISVIKNYCTSQMFLYWTLKYSIYMHQNKYLTLL